MFDLTGNIDHLHKSITVYCNLIKMPGVPINPQLIALLLTVALRSRFKLFTDRRDRDEMVELFAVAATNIRTEVLLRFCASCEWTNAARRFGQLSTRNAYETAISLMQESLSFPPTLEIQHSRLAAMCDHFQKIPLDYASYLVQIGQLMQAIETLK